MSTWKVTPESVGGSLIPLAVDGMMLSVLDQGACVKTCMRAGGHQGIVSVHAHAQGGLFAD